MEEPEWRHLAEERLDDVKPSIPFGDCCDPYCRRIPSGTPPFNTLEARKACSSLRAAGELNQFRNLEHHACTDYVLIGPVNTLVERAVAIESVSDMPLAGRSW